MTRMVILKCDMCGRDASDAMPVDPVQLVSGNRVVEIDLCSDDFLKLTEHGREVARRRGRPRKAEGEQPKRRGRPRKVVEGAPAEAEPAGEE